VRAILRGGGALSNAVVVGGGLGGLAAGIALEGAGYEVAVYEQAGGARGEGGSITLWSNGTAALAALGVAPSRVQAIERMLLKDGKGRDLLDLDIASTSEVYGHQSINIWRSDLVTELTNTFHGDIYFEKRCVGVEQRTLSSVARFADGTTAEGDVVVGADGVHSAVRSALFGGHATYTGTTCWEGRVKGWALDFPPQTVVAVATRSTYAMAFPMADSRVHWFVDTRQRLSNSAVPDKRTLEAICGDWPRPFPGLVAATDAEDLYQVPIYVRRPPRRWFAGRTVLLGDSAHGMGPALGQGGAQAFVDAAALRSALRGGSSVEDGLRRYQRQRVAAVLRLWIGSNVTLRMRRTGILAIATRLTSAKLAQRSFARSIEPDHEVRRSL